MGIGLSVQFTLWRQGCNNNRLITAIVLAAEHGTSVRVLPNVSIPLVLFSVRNTLYSITHLLQTFYVFSGDLVTFRCVGKVTCTAVQSYLHCSTKLLALQYKITCTAVQSYLHCSTKLLALQYKVTCTAVQSYLHCSTKLLSLQYREHSWLWELTTICTKVINLVKSSTVYANGCVKGR